MRESGDVKIRVFDAQGQCVAVLANKYIEAGTHTVFFNGEGYASGIYFYCVESGETQQIRKMLLVK